MPKMVECTGELVDSTDMAWLFRVAGTDEEDAVWIPKSLSEWEPDDEDSDTSTTGTMRVTAWFAHKEGLS